MFSQLTEQVKKSSQPASDLFAANVKALQAVSEQQTSLVSGVITDSVKLLKTFSEQTEVKGLLAAQSVYAESVRERLTSTSKNTYGTFNSVSQQYADAMKTSFETAKEAAETAGKSVAAETAGKSVAASETVKKKPAPAKKVAAKKAPVKAAPKASTPAPAKKEAPVAAKAAPSEKPVEASKPVPTLSADNVRASKPAAKKAPAKKPAAKKAVAKPAPKTDEKN